MSIKKKAKLLTVKKLIQLLEECDSKDASIELTVITKDGDTLGFTMLDKDTDIDYDFTDNGHIRYYIETKVPEKLADFGLC